ncbi:MAG: NAD(P)-dependent oxidoreductase [Acidobacteria bacterium]|nr:NAD(P)-dependent oxidoreductase [Acidobacteriota bacterium]
MSDPAEVVPARRIAVIGLGRMGWHIAAHLAGAGHHVTVCDVVPGLADRFVEEHGGRSADLPADAVTGSQLVVTSLPADRELQAVADGIVDVLGEGSVWIDHSTTSAEAARRVALLAAEHGASFLDAPVSGGVDGARNGTLTVMVGGDEAAFDSVAPVIAAYGARVVLMGESGAGQLTKMTNQICVVGLCQALAEGLDFAETAGLDVSRVIHVMLQGSSASWQMANRAERMLAGQYDYGFSTTLMRKDIGLVLDEAESMNVPLPVTAMVGQMLAEVAAMGGAQWDWCSLMERQRRRRTGR